MEKAAKVPTYTILLHVGYLYFPHQLHYCAVRLAESGEKFRVAELPTVWPLWLLLRSFLFTAHRGLGFITFIR